MPDMFLTATHSNDAERAVLGACLISANALGEVTERLRPEDFYNPDNRKVFETISAMLREGKPVDLVTVQIELNGRGELESLGGGSVK